MIARGLVGVVVVMLTTGGCCHPFPTIRARWCADGLPVKLLQDPRCPSGVCGWSCAPDRWREELGR